MEMKELLLSKLAEDPLLNHITLLEYEDDLFPDYILELKQEILYTSVEVAAMIDENDSTLRNYLRVPSINEYVKPVNVKRFIKYTYESVFKLHMIFILKKKQRMLVADIEHVLGVRDPVVVKSQRSRNGEKLPVDENVVTKREIYPVLNQMREMLVSLEKQSKLNKQHFLKEKEILLIDNEVNSLEKEIIKLEGQIQLEKVELELRRTSRRNVELVDVVLRKKLQSNTKQSFLQRLFANKDDVNEVDTTDVQREIELNKGEVDRLTKSINEKESSLIELRDKVIELNSTISQKNDELVSIGYFEVEDLVEIEFDLQEDEENNLIESK